MANYISAKLLWDPKLDANVLQHEWLTRAYGPQAGTIMEQFYQRLDGWFKTYYQARAFEYYQARESLFSDLYAPHYAEMEKLFLQAKAQPMSNLQKQRFQLLEDNMIVLQWRLRNAGYLKDSFTSPLQRNGDQVRDLMFDGHEVRQTRDKAFTLFPVTWYTGQWDMPLMKVALNQTSPQDATEEISNRSGYIFLYAKQAGTVNLKAGKVDAGSAFGGYQIYKNRSDWTVQQEGLFYSGGNISFEAEANTLYMISFKSYGVTGAELAYDLSIPGATIATGSFANGTMYLQGKDAPVYVFVPKELNLSSQNTSTGVTLSTQSPEDVARAAALQQHAGSKVLLKLDDNWRFQTDPQKNGLQQGVMNPEYDDQSWKTVTTTQVWQDQGFPNYHGTAWYRRSFDLPMTAGKIFLFFGAVDGDAVVYMNGQKVREHLLSQSGNGWDQPFGLDVTAQMKAGTKHYRCSSHENWLHQRNL